MKTIIALLSVTWCFSVVAFILPHNVIGIIITVVMCVLCLDLIESIWRRG